LFQCFISVLFQLCDQFNKSFQTQLNSKQENVSLAQDTVLQYDTGYRTQKKPNYVNTIPSQKMLCKCRIL